MLLLSLLRLVCMLLVLLLLRLLFTSNSAIANRNGVTCTW